MPSTGNDRGGEKAAIIIVTGGADGLLLPTIHLHSCCLVKDPKPLALLSQSVEEFVVRQLGMNADPSCLVKRERMIDISKMLRTIIWGVSPASNAVPVNAVKVAPLADLFRLL